MSLSLFLVTVVYAVVKVPSPLGRPEVFNIQATECTIRYEKLHNQGSTLITGYLIESKEEWGFLWEERGVTSELQYRMINFTPVTHIKFRVSAGNAAGLSAPSEASDYITLMDPFS